MKVKSITKYKLKNSSKMEKEGKFIYKEMLMKVNSKIIDFMEKVNIFGKMEIIILDRFKMDYVMVKDIGSKNQPQINMKENTNSIKERVKDSINGETVIFILDNLNKI